MIAKKELLNEVLFSPLNLVSGHEDTIIRNEKGWYQIINPSFAEADRNEVIICDKEITDVQSFFEEVRREYFDLNLPFKWCWNPLSRPLSLQRVLDSKCSKSWNFSGMACDPSQIDISIPKDVTVVEVREENLDDYLDCMIEGWNIGNREKIEKSCLAQIRSINQEKYFFISKLDGKVAGAASFTKYKKSCYLGGAVVFPEYRGKGLYKALIQKRLRKVYDLKISIATTQARVATSAPILTNLGFQRVFTGVVYQFNV